MAGRPYNKRIETKQYAEIRRRRKSGAMLKDLAAYYGVSLVRISQICRNIPTTEKRVGQCHVCGTPIARRAIACYKHANKKSVRPLAERFWEKVQRQENGCYEWTASLGPGGYGQFLMKRDGQPKRMYPASRIAWELQRGPIPKGMFVCHHCDNRKCVRPDHLFLGTIKDNVFDARQKGRLQHKITLEQVREIQRTWDNDTTPRHYGVLTKMKKQYGVSFTLLWKIVHRRLLYSL